MMRLVKGVAGIQDSGNAASSSFITEFPASNPGPSKKGQIMSNMGGDVLVTVCDGVQITIQRLVVLFGLIKMRSGGLMVLRGRRRVSRSVPQPSRTRRPLAPCVCL